MQQILMEFERIKQMVSVAEIDLHKFIDSGNKAAATRVRKAMMQVKNGAGEIRKLISDAKNDGAYKLGGK